MWTIFASLVVVMMCQWTFLTTIFHILFFFSINLFWERSNIVMVEDDVILNRNNSSKTSEKLMSQNVTAMHCYQFVFGASGVKRAKKDLTIR